MTGILNETDASHFPREVSFLAAWIVICIGGRNLELGSHKYECVGCYKLHVSN
jgi:hypothetical protein